MLLQNSKMNLHWIESSAFSLPFLVLGVFSRTESLSPKHVFFDFVSYGLHFLSERIVLHGSAQLCL